MATKTTRKKDKITERNAPAYRAMLSAGIAKKAIESHETPTDGAWQDWVAYNMCAAVEDLAFALQTLLEERNEKAD